MASQVVAFGHGVPLSHPALAGLAVADVTRAPPLAPRPASRIAPLLEPFLDPFVRAFLFALEAGALDGAALILVWRQGPGALHAYRYAAELRRLGLLPPGPPLHLWNRARPGSPGAARFDAVEDARLSAALSGLPRGPAIDRAGPLAALEALQAAGRICGAEAQRRRLAARAGGVAVDAVPSPAPPPAPPPPGRRLALAGAPLGNAALHDWLAGQGLLVLDLTSPDPPEGEPGDLLTARGVDEVIWQVDPNDDLHGWRMPDLRALCARSGIGFRDLGFVPPWPSPADLARLPGGPA